VPAVESETSIDCAFARLGHRMAITRVWLLWLAQPQGRRAGESPSPALEPGTRTSHKSDLTKIAHAYYDSAVAYMRCQRPNDDDS
jgi:hypothetical protein